MSKYALINRMNQQTLSTHRTLRAAVKAARDIQPAKKNSYLPVTYQHADGSPLTTTEIDELDRIDYEVNR